MKSLTCTTRLPVLQFLHDQQTRTKGSNEKRTPEKRSAVHAPSEKSRKDEPWVSKSNHNRLNAESQTTKNPQRQREEHSPRQRRSVRIKSFLDRRVTRTRIPETPRGEATQQESSPAQPTSSQNSPRWRQRFCSAPSRCSSTSPANAQVRVNREVSRISISEIKEPFGGIPSVLNQSGNDFCAWFRSIGFGGLAVSLRLCLAQAAAS